MVTLNCRLVNGSSKPIQHVIIVSGCEDLKLFGLIYQKHRKAVRDVERAAVTILSLKKPIQAVFMLRFTTKFKYH